MRLLLLGVLIVIGVSALFIIVVNARNLKKHGCEGSLAIPSAILLLIVSIVLSVIAYISLIQYSNTL